MNRKFTFNRIFFLVFTVLWSTFILWNLITPAKVFSENENRYLAAIPDFTFDKFIKGDYMNGINDYINDQFVLRDDWISIKTMLERVMLKQDINSVYFAKDGYLIEKHNSKDVSEKLSEKNKEYLVQFVDKYLSKLGKERVKAILVPTSSEILTDKLPLFATGYDQNNYMDQLIASLPKGTFLDLRDTLVKHKEEYIYYRTDHHWTALGAYYAYEQWCKEIGVEAIEQDQFDIILATNEFYGTLHSKVNVKVKPDDIYLYQRKEDMGYQLIYNLTDKANSLYDYSKLKGKDKYSVYMGGNNPVVEIETNNMNGRKLLVIKDSFAHSFVPFAVNHFEKTYMIDFRYFNGNVEAYMEENGITDVLVLYNTMSFVKDDYLAKLIK